MTILNKLKKTEILLFCIYIYIYIYIYKKVNMAGFYSDFATSTRI
jgi:hypothetical protein